MRAAGVFGREPESGTAIRRAAVVFPCRVTPGVVVMLSKGLQNRGDVVGLVINENLCLIPCRPVRLHIVLH